jgi:hypothetical protein
MLLYGSYKTTAQDTFLGNSKNLIKILQNPKYVKKNLKI